MSNTNNTSFFKTIKTFIFEFIIVTLGILTAFGINKWDENKKLQIEEEIALESLKKDLESDLYVFNFYKQTFIKGNTYLIPILGGNYDNMDTLEYYIQSSFDLQEGNATYTNLKYSGKLDIIENTKIKRSLILYYETYYQGLENMSVMNHEFTFDFIKPYLIKHLPYQYTSKDLKKLLKNDEFLNLIKTQNDILQYNISTIEKSENLINKIIQELDEELKTIP